MKWEHLWCRFTTDVSQDFHGDVGNFPTPFFDQIAGLPENWLLRRFPLEAGTVLQVQVWEWSGSGLPLAP
jgi:hypothetical protein